VTHYRTEWRFTDEEEDWLKEMSIGSVLHVCCGESELGTVRVDCDEKIDCEVRADVENLPFEKHSYGTVICDPPWSFYNRFRWVQELKDVAHSRVILSTPLIKLAIGRDWKKELHCFEHKAVWGEKPHGFLFMRMFQVFTYKNRRLQDFEGSENAIPRRRERDDKRDNREGEKGDKGGRVEATLG
jgi:hypothetical protein